MLKRIIVIFMFIVLGVSASITLYEPYSSEMVSDYNQIYTTSITLSGVNSLSGTEFSGVANTYLLGTMHIIGISIFTTNKNHVFVANSITDGSRTHGVVHIINSNIGVFFETTLPTRITVGSQTYKITTQVDKTSRRNDDFTILYAIFVGLSFILAVPAYLPKKSNRGTYIAITMIVVLSYEVFILIGVNTDGYNDMILFAEFLIIFFVMLGMREASINRKIPKVVTMSLLIFTIVTVSFASVIQTTGEVTINRTMWSNGGYAFPYYSSTIIYNGGNAETYYSIGETGYSVKDGTLDVNHTADIKYYFGNKSLVNFGETMYFVPAKDGTITTIKDYGEHLLHISEYYWIVMIILGISMYVILEKLSVDLIYE